MDSLEKLFLSCLVLFGMFILFLFGLYFDLGDMLASSLHRDERNATGIGMTDHLIAKMEDRARPREIMPTALDIPRGGSGDGEEMIRAGMRALGRGGAPMSLKVIQQNKRANLIASGVKNEQVLEMETLGEDKEELSKIRTQVLRLAAEKKYPAAIVQLNDAINQTNPKNLIVLREMLGLQVQLYMDAKDMEKAKDAARRLYELLDRMMAIRKLEGSAFPGLETEIARIKSEKEILDQMYQDLQKRTEETGSPTGLTAAEKTQMKEAMTRARQQGSMSEEEYQRAIKELE